MRRGSIETNHIEVSMKNKGSRAKNLKPKGAKKERSRLRSKRGKTLSSPL
jgi:hypothetical protein